MKSTPKCTHTPFDPAPLTQRILIAYMLRGLHVNACAQTACMPSHLLQHEGSGAVHKALPRRYLHQHLMLWQALHFVPQIDRSILRAAPALQIIFRHLLRPRKPARGENRTFAYCWCSDEPVQVRSKVCQQTGLCRFQSCQGSIGRALEASTKAATECTCVLKAFCIAWSPCHDCVPIGSRKTPQAPVWLRDKCLMVSRL